jgi:hypothetical protein
MCQQSEKLKEFNYTTSKLPLHLLFGYAIFKHKMPYLCSKLRFQSPPSIVSLFEIIIRESMPKLVKVRMIC